MKFILTLFVIAFATSPASATDLTADPHFIFPAIPDHGGIVSLPEAAIQPAAGAKVILDVAAADLKGGVLKALDAAARLVNVYAEGDRPISITIVFHGPATRATLDDVGYGRQEDGARNPNLQLLRALRKQGVEIFVCGQALAQQGFATADVAPSVNVAVSATTVLISRQMDGFAYLPYL